MDTYGINNIFRVHYSFTQSLAVIIVVPLECFFKKKFLSVNSAHTHTHKSFKSFRLLYSD